MYRCMESRHAKIWGKPFQQGVIVGLWKEKRPLWTEDSKQGKLGVRLRCQTRGDSKASKKQRVTEKMGK